MSDYHGPDHLLTVTTYPYRRYAADTSAWTDVVDVDHDIAHPANCDALKYGEHCSLDHYLHDNGSEDLPNEPGTYTVSDWGRGPDHNGEYDAGLTVGVVTEPVGASA